MGLHGLWLGLTVSLVYCAALGTYLCLRTDWEREVKKVVERVRKDRAKDQCINENAPNGRDHHEDDD